MNICICGGGSLGHVCAGILASHDDVRVSLFTKRPEQWNFELSVQDPVGKEYVSTLYKVSSDPADLINEADLVLICVPGFLIEQVLKEISPYLNPSTLVGSIVSNTGFFFKAHELLAKNTPLFGFQRTPFISRINEYGKSAFLLGYKKEISLAVENVDDVESFRLNIERLFLTPTVLLNNFYEASLTNSNPILHTGRLYSMWHTWDGHIYDHNILFYKEWTDEASQLLIDMDQEFMALLSVLGISKEVVPSLLDYYESTDAESLTRKISSIAAFQTITSPMKPVEGGWIPDFESRYFIEDFPYGLKIIKEQAEIYGISTPVIDKVLTWGMSVLKL